MVISISLKTVWEKLDGTISSAFLLFGILGVLLLATGILVGWIIFPSFLHNAVKSRVNLGPGTDSRKRWAQLPEMTFNVYLFNITNPSGVLQGDKPIVHEIGPYCFKELKEKLDVSEDTETDTLSYRPRTTWFENQQDPSCTAPHLTGQELLLVPNVPMMAILLIAEKDFPSIAMPVLNQALPYLFGRVNDVFLRATAKDLLFGGITIDCSNHAVLAQIVCGSIKEKARGLKMIGDEKYSFSFFGGKNASSERTWYTVKRGTLDSEQVGRVVAVDDKPELPFWRGTCNQLHGTDASILPPFRKKINGSFAVYSGDICRVIYGIFEREINFRGVSGYAFTASFGNAEDNSEDKCFCPSDDRCYKKGALDVYKCQGAPLVSSQPHFYQASPYYLKAVRGLSPDKSRHGIFVVLEPISGTPLLVQKRIQLNIDLKPFQFVPVTQGLQRTLVPLFWAEEVFELDESLMDVLYASLLRPIRIIDFLKWLCVVVGAVLLILVFTIKLSRKRKHQVHALEGGIEKGVKVLAFEYVKRY